MQIQRNANVRLCPPIYISMPDRSWLTFSSNLKTKISTFHIPNAI